MEEKCILEIKEDSINWKLINDIDPYPVECPYKIENWRLTNGKPQEN